MAVKCTRRTVGLAAAWLALLGTPAPSASPGTWTYFVDHSDIRALHEQGDTLWVGTAGGVLLVNVLTGDVVSRLDAASGLPSNSVRARLGWGRNVYVGTDAGLAACRPARGGGVVCEPAGGYPDIRHLSFGPSGTLYVGTFGHGVAQIRDSRVAWVTIADSLLDNKVYAVHEAPDAAVLYATSMGLCAHTETEWVGFQAGAGIPRGEIRDLVEAPGRGAIWRAGARDYYLLVAGRGVYLFDGRRARSILRGALFRENAVADIDVAADGTLWAAGQFGALGRYRDGVWGRVGEGDEDVANARWRCVHVGGSGTVYFGSADGLLVAADERDIRKVLIPSALPGGCVGPMAEDPLGRKYVGSGAYLVSYEDDRAGFGVEKEFGSVLAIAVSPDSTVWVTGRWGLYRRQSDRWVEVVGDIDPRPPLFTALAFDASGDLWAGAESGEIFRFDSELWLRYAGRREFAGGTVDRLVVDSVGTAWGLADSSVWSYGGSEWNRVETERFGPEGVVDVTLDPAGDPVVLTRRNVWKFTQKGGWGSVSTPNLDGVGGYRAIEFDEGGRVYLGTDRGIALMDGGISRWVGPGDGLRGKEVTSILVDSDGVLWVGFRRDGISRISLENLW